MGKFILDGIPPAPAFKEKVKVSFTYDVNGILQVEATILSNGKKAGITIETLGINMEPEIDLTMWENAPKTRRYRRLIKRAEKMLKHRESIFFEGELDEAIKDLKKALIKEDNQKLLKLEERLIDLLHDLEDELE